MSAENQNSDIADMKTALFDKEDLSVPGSAFETSISDAVDASMADGGMDSEAQSGEKTVFSVPAIPIPSANSENSASSSADGAGSMSDHTATVMSMPSIPYPPDGGNDTEFDSNEQESLPSYLLPSAGEQFDNFIVEERLGAGGFGAVYRVKNPSLGREEALKVILPEVANEKNNDKRFLREVNVISRIEHPNIVRLYNSGATENGVKWMTMELLVGSRLDKLIRKHGVLSFEESKAIIIQLLNGLQEAHSRNLIHRDLKPSNIILTEQEGYGAMVKILDFGLAKALGKDENMEVQALTQMVPNCVFGTPQYMAPEQLQPKMKTGPWSDVYSSALLFIEMMTGKQAVAGDSLVEVAFKQLKGEISLPHAWKGRAIGAVIEKALANKSEDRYQNAGEFRDALKKINSVDDPVGVLNTPKEDHRVGLCGVYLPMRHKESSPSVKASNKPVSNHVPVFFVICTIGFFVLLNLLMCLIFLMSGAMDVLLFE